MSIWTSISNIGKMTLVKAGLAEVVGNSKKPEVKKEAPKKEEPKKEIKKEAVKEAPKEIKKEISKPKAEKKAKPAVKSDGLSIRIERQIAPKVTLPNGNNIVHIKQDGIEFVIDKSDHQKFLFEFDKEEYDLLVENGYLARKKDGELEFFHNFLLQKEIERTAKRNDVSSDEVEVLHKNSNKSDNRRENLQIVVKSDSN